jgi:hypothetical protein
VGTPFSQRDVHVRGNRRAAQIMLAETDEQAYELALASQVRYLFITPLQAIESPPGKLTEHLRLYRTPEDSRHFRLIYDSAEIFAPAGRPVVRVFEIVAAP